MPDNLTILDTEEFEGHFSTHRLGKKISVHITSYWEPSVSLADYSISLRGERMKIDFESSVIGAPDGFILSYHCDPITVMFQENSVITEWKDIKSLIDLQTLTARSYVNDVSSDSFLDIWKAKSSEKGTNTF